MTRGIESRLAKLEAKRPSELSALSDAELVRRIRNATATLANHPDIPKAEKARYRELLRKIEVGDSLSESDLALSAWEREAVNAKR